MLTLYTILFFMKVLIPLTPIILPALLIFAIVNSRMGPKQPTQQPQCQNQNSIRTEDEKIQKTEFASLSKEEKMEILTQKYLTILTREPDYDGYGEACNSYAEMPSVEDYWNDEEENIIKAVCEKSRGYFGYEYSAGFEGFTISDTTEEEEMAALA